MVKRNYKRHCRKILKPWEQFILSVASLLKIKAIITLVIVFIFCYKTFSDMEVSSDFLTIFAVVITYWLCERTKGKKGEQ